MNKLPAMLIGLVAGITTAQGGDSCRSYLVSTEAFSSLGTEIRPQPVFSRSGGIRGWRIWGIRSSRQLSAQGLREGTLLTHVCGVAANDIDVKGSICCDTDAAREYEVTFRLDDDSELKMLVTRSGN
jgi:hypothetical protein